MISKHTLIGGIFSAALCCQAAHAELPCSPDEIAERTIPAEKEWVEATPTQHLSNAQSGWVRPILGFDWRIIDTEDFGYIEVPTENREPRFFILRSDYRSCGSGGCTMGMYDCKTVDDEGSSCKSIWGGFQGRVRFPGSQSEGYPDFVIDGTDLYTFANGEYRAVCNVTVIDQWKSDRD